MIENYQNQSQSKILLSLNALKNQWMYHLWQITSGKYQNLFLESSHKRFKDKDFGKVKGFYLIIFIS